MLFSKLHIQTGGIGRHVVLLFAAFALIVSPTAHAADTANQQPSLQSGTVGTAAAGVGGCAASALAGILSGGASSLLPSVGTALFSVQTNDMVNNMYQGSAAVRDDVLNCMARALARTVLQQVTASTVNWINSGFQGSPSFVQNYNQFFTNIADQTAGQFIGGSDLAFLCSPFKLQIKIAIASAYQMRRQAPSCTLTSVTNNIQGFMNNFGQGGWPAYLSYATVPTNNPYGAFMYGQAQLANTLNNVQGNNRLDLTLGQGFMSFKQEQNCRTTTNPPPASDSISVKVVQQADPNGYNLEGDTYRVCDMVNTTPGTAIAQSLDKTIGAGPDSLVNAKYFDEIISALISQLIQNTLYTGLSNLSAHGGYQNNFTDTTSPSALAAQLSQQISAAMQTPQQIASAEQQNIALIASTTPQVQDAVNCWQALATSTSSTEAVSNASSTQAVLTTLTNRQSAYQSLYARVYNIINTLTQYQAAAANIQSLSGAQTLTQQFIQYSTTGALPTLNDVYVVQQDQNQLQTDLANAQQSAATSLAQCHAASQSNTSTQ